MRNLLIVFLSSVFIVSTSDLFAQLKQRPPTEDINKGYQIGDLASDFELKGVDGVTHSLASMKSAKGYVVIFTSNVCPYAILYEDRIIALHEKTSQLGYPVVAINSNDAEIEPGDSQEEMIKRAADKKFPYVYLKDDKGVFAKYGALKTPHVFLLDQELTVRYIGAIDDNAHEVSEVQTRYVENAIHQLEQGNTPNPDFTKAIGCPIKVKKAMVSSEDRPSRNDRRGPPTPQRLLEMMDKDKDQKISSDEAHGPLKNDFSRIDSDQDGFLSVKELESMKPKQGRRPSRNN